MSRTNLDFLFQVTAPTGERGFGTLPRGDALRPGFGDHLSKAASTQMGPKSTSNSSDRPAANDASSDDFEPRSTSEPRDERAPVAETKRSDRDDPQAERAPKAAEGAAETDESIPVRDDVATDNTEDDDEDAVELSEAASAAVVENAQHNGAVVTATAELQEPLAPIDGSSPTDTATTSSAEKARSTTSATALPSEPTTSATNDADATTYDATAAQQIAATSDSLQQSTQSPVAKKIAGGKSVSQRVDESTESESLQAANGSVTPETTVEQAVTAPSVAANVEAPNPDANATDVIQAPEREFARDEKRDADTSAVTRQRSEATALAAKAATTAVANTAAPQPENVAAANEAAEGAAPVGKVAPAKADAINDAAHRLSAGRTSSSRSARANSADEMPRVDPARFVGRVAKAFQTAQERGGTLQIRLSPPELGAMRLELSVKDGVMTASLETESTAARRVLLEHLPALRERLAEQNVRIESFDVDVRRDGTGGQADPRATQDQQQSQQGRPDRRHAAPQQREVAAPRVSPAPISPLTSNTGINLVA